MSANRIKALIYAIGVFTVFIMMGFVVLRYARGHPAGPEVISGIVVAAGCWFCATIIARD